MRSSHPLCRASRAAGATLLEGALALSLTGVFLAVFVPVFVRSVSTDRLDEPVRELAALEAKLSAYYGADRPGETRCLPAFVAPWTRAAAAADSLADAGVSPAPSNGYEAIGFTPEPPAHFAYEVLTSGSGCAIADGVEVVVRASADLDQDGERSTFERTLVTQGNALRRRTGIASTRPLE
jgi:hypothetical protein